MKLSGSETSHVNGFSSTLRALGLQALGQISFPWMAKKGDHHAEVPKPVVRTSLSASLALATINILPVMGSTSVIGLNLGHLWLGVTLPGSLTDSDLMSAIFQVFAKIQELLMVASLTTVVYHIIVHNLVTAEGVPFGFIFGTFSFSEFSYFWSSEFLGGMGGQISTVSKAGMAAILLAAGLIAAFAGPSVAVLLIPRQQDWQAGGTEFYLRGNESDIFPGNLSISDLPVECTGPDASNYAICPSGGFKPLSLYTSSLQTIRNDENMVPVPTSSTGQWGSYGLFQQQLVSIPSIHLGTQQLPMSIISGSIRGIVCQTEAVAPFVPIALYSSYLSNDWESIAATAQFSPTRPSLAEYRWRNSKTVSAKGKIPAVRTMCSAAQNLSTTATAVNFPVLPATACPDGELAVSLPQLNNTPSSRARVTWIHNFPDELGSVSAGIIFEAPWTNSDTSRTVVGCSVDARWTKGDVKNNQAYPNVIASTENWKIVAGYIAPMFMPPNNQSWAPIHLDGAWVQVADSGSLQSLLASSAIIDNNMTTATDQTATWNKAVQGSANRTLLLEWITSLSVVDSLSRYGAYRFLNTTGPIYDWALLDYHRQPDYTNKLLAGKPALVKPVASEVPIATTYRLAIVLNGLLYRASSPADFLAMAILISHMLIALGHTISLVVYRKSSASWDTIAELVALAHNSKPSKKALKNASAGIRTKRPFSHIAQVKAIAQDTRSHEARSETTPNSMPLLAPHQAQLVFVESDDEDDHETGSNGTHIAPADAINEDGLRSSRSGDSDGALLPAPNPGVITTRTWPQPWPQTHTNREKAPTRAQSRNVSTNSTKSLLASSSVESLSRRSPYTLIEPDQIYS